MVDAPDDVERMVERLSVPGTWARHKDNLVASSAAETLVRDDAPFEAAALIQSLSSQLAEMRAKIDVQRVGVTQVVSEAMVDTACAAYHAAYPDGTSRAGQQGMRAALTAALASPTDADVAVDVDAYTRTGIYDRDGREILVGDIICIDLTSPHTKEEYWKPKYRVEFKAPSYILEHIGGDKDSDTARWVFRTPQVSSTQRIETLTADKAGEDGR